MNYLRDLKTIQKVEEIKSSLDTLSLKISGYSGKDIKGLFEDSFGHNYYIFEALLDKKGISLDEPTKIKVFIDELSKQLSNASYVELTLGFRPNEKSMSKILDWIHDNVSENLVLKLTYDPSIIAGTRISYDGKYGDYSARKKFDAYFSNIKNLKVTQDA